MYIYIYEYINSLIHVFLCIHAYNYGYTHVYTHTYINIYTVVATPYVQVNMTRDHDNTKRLLVWGFIPIINEIHARLFDDHDIVSDIIHGSKKILIKKIKNLNSQHTPL